MMDPRIRISTSHEQHGTHETMVEKYIVLWYIHLLVLKYRKDFWSIH